jgi:clan AA aspartic protease (TIGR02281 family)
MVIGLCSKRIAVSASLLVMLLPSIAQLAQAQTTDAVQIIAQWNASNAMCRKVNMMALEAIGQCEQRDTLSKLLALMHYCYGPNGEGGTAGWSVCDAAKKAKDTRLARTAVKFQRANGVFVLPATLNGTTQSFFVVDSGASNVQIPQEVADSLASAGTLGQSDFLGERRYVLANGGGLLQRVIRLRSIQIGNRTMENVLAAVGPPHSQALLGESVLRRLNWWKIDNVENAIELEFTGSY